MRDRLTHHNLQANSHAAYLFHEDGPVYRGRRLFLTKIREEKDTDLIKSLRHRQYPDKEEEAKFLVYFKVDQELPLIGSGT